VFVDCSSPVIQVYVLIPQTYIGETNRRQNGRTFGLKISIRWWSNKVFWLVGTKINGIRKLGKNGYICASIARTLKVKIEPKQCKIRVKSGMRRNSTFILLFVNTAYEHVGKEDVDIMMGALREIKSYLTFNSEVLLSLKFDHLSN
jgi:hypothetical protein